MLTRAQKEEAVATLNEKLSRATSVVVADYRGLAVPEVEELRSKLREATEGETEYQVAKNSLLKLAANGSSCSRTSLMDRRSRGSTPATNMPRRG